MIKQRIIYITLLLISIAVFIATNTRQMLVFTALLICAALVSLIFLVIFEFRGRIVIEFSESGVLSKKNYMKVRLDKGVGIFSVRVCVYLKIGNYLYGNEERIRLWLSPAGEKDGICRVPWEAADCGCFSIECTHAFVYDVLGLWKISLRRPGSIVYLSFPALPPIDAVQKNESNIYQSGNTYDTRKSGNDVNEVFEIRDYHEGDSLNRVHWKLSEKLDKYLVREFSRPVDEYTMIYCDSAFEGYDRNHLLVNDVIGMSSALSQALIIKGVKHRLSTVSVNDFIDKTIESRDDLYNAISEFLSIRLQKRDGNYTHLRAELSASRLLVVTAYFHEEIIEELANMTDLTVIVLVNDGREYAEIRDNYKLIVLSTDKLYEKTHRLEI